MANVTREFPNKLDHVLTGRPTSRGRGAASDLLRLVRWHSCVHAYWVLARLTAASATCTRRAHPHAVRGAHHAGQRRQELASISGRSPHVRAALRHGLAADAGRRATQPTTKHGRALAAHAASGQEPSQTRVARLSRRRALSGARRHASNSAFALELSRLEYAPRQSQRSQRSPTPVRGKARGLVRSGDADCPAWEPTARAPVAGLIEALCMSRVCGTSCEFRMARSFRTRAVAERTRKPALWSSCIVWPNARDLRFSHLDGLQPQPRWCGARWRAAFDAGDPRRACPSPTADAHLAASLRPYR